jgi:hypothetical protein
MSFIIVNKKVESVKVVCDNYSVCTVETEKGQRFTFNKWPRQHWGTLRGVFKNREAAQRILDGPEVVFDSDGHHINKISKSAQ